jgi:hypothetical protein
VLVSPALVALSRYRPERAVPAVAVWSIAWLVLVPGTWSLNRARAPHGYRVAGAFRAGAFDNNADDLGRVLRSVYRPGDVYASAAIGHMGYYSRPVPMFDMLGLAEPAIAKSKGKSTNGGKYDLRFTAEQRPAVIIDVTPATVVGTARLARDRYCGLVSPGLTRRLLYVAVRCDLDARIAKPLTARFGGRAVGIRQANRAWTRERKARPRFG